MPNPIEISDPTTPANRLAVDPNGAIKIAAGTALIGKVGIAPGGYTATATFTPAAAA